MAPKSTAILLALGVSTLASPAAKPGSPLEIRGTLTPAELPTATAIGGAMDTSDSEAGIKQGAMLAEGPEYLTLQITNSQTFAISTSHARAEGSPTPVGGAVGAGTITAGGVASMVVPTSYAGNIAIVEVGGTREITGDDSLIEFNYNIPDGYDYAVADVDISYVNGFSVPIICSCDSVEVTGCSKSLWALNTCGDDDGVGACINPLRADTDATAATTFFAPCEGEAYTYPNDNAANSFGECQNGVISCCVGPEC